MSNYIPIFLLSNLCILPNQELKIDVSNEVSKKVIKDAAKTDDKEVLVIAPRNSVEVSPSIEDLPSIGVIAVIKSRLELSNGKLRTVLIGKKRVEITKYYQNKATKVLKCSYNDIEIKEENSNTSALKRKLLTSLNEYITLDKSVSNSILSIIKDIDDLYVLTDVIASFMPFNFDKKLSYIECISASDRATKLISDLQEEINISNIDKELDEKLQVSLENGQREYILKEKLKEINNELGNNREDEICNLLEKVNSLKLDNKVTNKLINEIKKYSNSSEYSPEAAVVKNYLDTVINLPWNEFSKENTDVKEISKILDEEHYGLNDIKDRILEYVLSKKFSSKVSSPIICLIGPPGVGKTSTAYSIAKALNREFYKISVGGLNDSTELIGSRKTYLGAAPGKIMQAIIKSKVNNPLILIDEVDKMVKDYKGDPASTLLEILDPTQNKEFTDNYIEEPFDISNVLFILTANDIASIPPMLLDRVEVFNISSYTNLEKVDIAKNYLLKNIFEEYGITFKVNKDVLEYIVKNYTKEPGVRELKRCLEKLVRKVLIYEKDAKSLTIKEASKYLEPINLMELSKIRDYGIVNTLAYTLSGGSVSHTEVARSKGNGKVTITGNLGDVLKESVMVCLSLLKSSYDIDTSEYDLHIHFIENGIKKDGPSAGVAIAVAIYSLFERKVISSDYAFTGEVTLKGDILPVGGIKEKLVSAASNGVKHVFIPKANEFDLKDVPVEVFNDLNVKLVSNFSEIYDALFR